MEAKEMNGTRKAVWQQVYILACLFLLVWELICRIELPGTRELSLLLTGFELILTGMLISHISIRAHKWTWPLLLFFPLVIVQGMLQGWNPIEQEVDSLNRAVFVFLVVGMLGLLLDREEMKKWLRKFILIWTVTYAAIACAGIWAASKGIIIYTGQSNAMIGLDKDFGRLWLFKYYTGVGEELCFTLMMACIGMAISEGWRMRLIYLLLMIPLTIGLALTDSRNAIICAGGGFGLVAATILCVRGGCKAGPMRRSSRRTKKVRQGLLFLLVVLLCTMLVYMAVTSIVPAFNMVVSGKTTGVLIEVAHAEATAERTEKVTQAVHRTGTTNILNNRQKIWNAGIQLLLDHPRLLLVGTTIGGTEEYYAEYYELAGIAFQHIHCMPLQILIELGIGGLGLYLWFQIMFLWSGFRLLFASGLPLWERMMPIPAVCILVAEMAECITKLSYGYASAPLFMLFAGMTIVCAEKRRS